MKRFLATLAVTAALFPMLSLAQTNAPLTRAQVYAQIVQAQRDDTLHTSKVHYPDDVIAHPDASQHAYGASAEGSAQSGGVTQPARGALGQPLYLHH
jgi:hypothetical protein